MAVPLSGFDKSFVALDTKTTPQVLSVYFVVGSGFDVGRFRRRLESFVKAFPHLRTKLNGSGSSWIVDNNFCISNCLSERIVESDSVISEARDTAFEVIASEEFGRALRPEETPWRIVIIRGDAVDSSGRVIGTARVLTLFHHSYIDGLGVRNLLHHLTESFDVLIKGEETEVVPPTEAESKQRLSGERTSLLSKLKVLSTLLRHPPKSPIRGVNSANRVLTLTSFELAEIRALSTRYRVSQNDIYLTLVTFALGQLFRKLERCVPTLDILMPVASPAKSDGALTFGNHLAAVNMRLPISSTDILDILRKVSIRSREGRLRHVISAQAVVASLATRLPKKLQNVVFRRYTHCSDCICTNIPYLTTDRSLGGAPILGIYGVPALLRGQGLAFSFVRYSKKVCVVIMFDPNIFGAPGVLKNLFEEGLEKLDYEASRMSSSSLVSPRSISWDDGPNEKRA